MSEFFAMGGYALYVWGSYVVAAVVLTALAVISAREARRMARRAEELKQHAPHRRGRNRRETDA
jgi:heme exporter protein D